MNNIVLLLDVGYVASRDQTLCRERERADRGIRAIFRDKIAKNSVNIINSKANLCMTTTILPKPNILSILFAIEDERKRLGEEQKKG
jgi:hypothetical protein